MEAAEQLEGWGGHHHHCPPNSWSRWLQRLEGILAGRPGEKAQKVPACDSCPPQDMAVPKEHRTPDLETPLLTASLQDCHTSGQI